MNILFWGITLGVIGKIVLGVAVIRVHMNILTERKIDMVVLRSIKREQVITFFGILLIVVGYVLEVYFYSGMNLFSCTGRDCAAAVSNALN